MPAFHYDCDQCGFDQDQYLRSEKSTILMMCKRCGRQVVARQMRDNSAEFKEKDFVIGELKHE